MIGLAGLANGAHPLRHPDGPLFVVVRRRRIAYAELWSWRNGIMRWAGDPDAPRFHDIRAGFEALARKVVVPID